MARRSRQLRHGTPKIKERHQRLRLAILAILSSVARVIADLGFRLGGGCRGWIVVWMLEMCVESGIM